MRGERSLIRAPFTLCHALSFRPARLEGQLGVKWGAEACKAVGKS